MYNLSVTNSTIHARTRQGEIENNRFESYVGSIEVECSSVYICLYIYRPIYGYVCI